MKCRCGNEINAYDRYCLGRDTEICVQCSDNRVNAGQYYKPRRRRDRLTKGKKR